MITLAKTAMMRGSIISVANPYVGEALFTFSSALVSDFWLVPDGITSICVLCIGPGGRIGGTISGRGTGGGGGGAVSYTNNIVVTPGESLKYSILGGAGGYATLERPGVSTLVSAAAGSDSNGGTGGAGGLASNGIGDVRFSGGNGGNGSNSASPLRGGGGGGAAGYLGNGGAGGTFTNSSTANGSAGASNAPDGGGAAYTNAGCGGGGGGVGPFGNIGTNGTIGLGSSSGMATGGGGNAQNADWINIWNTKGADANGSNNSIPVGAGGVFGGGCGGGCSSSSNNPGYYGAGAVYIIWGAGRAFPSTNTYPMGAGF